jgi:lysophospholipase L1-like esterase
MSRRRYFDLAAIAVTIAVFAGVGLVLDPQETPTLRVDPSAARVDRPQPAASTLPSVLFIGDSYTAGNGLAEMSYGCMAAVRMGWLCDLSAVPGTGYISGGQANRFIVDPYVGPSTSFAERIPNLAEKYQPDLVILDGGRNDVFVPRDGVFRAMSAAIDQVRHTWPGAEIVLVRPRLLGKPDDDLGFDDDFFDHLKAQHAAEGMVVVDPISQLAGIDTSGMLRADGMHPNQPGEQALSSALVNSLLTYFTPAKT